MFEAKVDSCMLFIPLEKCSIINQQLIDNFTEFRINENSGETETTKSYNGLPFHEFYEDSTSVKIWIKKQITNDENGNKYSKDYIYLLANSKHLKSDYFQGINKDTLKKLYDYYISLNVFHCTFETFKNAGYTDIDLCFDFKCDEESFAILKKNMLKSAINEMHFYTSNKFDNSGIWTPTKKDPRNQSTPGKPYIKVYSKDKDFTYKSFKFANKYFNPKDFEDLARFECTIKNYEHKRKLGLSDKPTIWDFLNSDLRLTIKKIAMSYFEKPQYVNTNKNLSPMDLVLIDSINMHIENGVSIHKIHKLFDRYDVNRKARQRLLQKYHDLYSQDLINKKKLEGDNISSSLFQYLGLDEPENQNNDVSK